MGKTYPGQVDLSTWEQGYYTAVDDSTGNRIKVHVRKGEPRPKVYNNMHLPMYNDGKGNFYSYVPEGMVSLDRPWTERELFVQQANNIYGQGSKDALDYIDKYYDSFPGNEQPLQDVVVTAKAAHPEIIEWQEARKAELDRLTKKLDTEQNIRAALKRNDADNQVSRRLSLNIPTVQDMVFRWNFGSPQSYDITKHPQFNRMYDFVQQDVVPRMLNAFGEENKLTPERYAIITKPLTSYNFYTNPVNGDYGGGVSPGSYDKIVITDPDNKEDTIMHELDHAQRGQLGDLQLIRQYPIGQPGYTNKEVELLNQAYDYSIFKPMTRLQSNPVADAFAAIRGVTEKSSVNRQIRYNIYQKTGLTGEDLDNYIDNLPDEKLLDYYNISYVHDNLDWLELKENPEKLHDLMQKVRAALKYVADNNQPSSDWQPNNYNIT